MCDIILSENQYSFLLYCSGNQHFQKHVAGHGRPYYTGGIQFYRTGGKGGDCPFADTGFRIHGHYCGGTDYLVSHDYSVGYKTEEGTE